MVVLFPNPQVWASVSDADAADVEPWYKAVFMQSVAETSPVDRQDLAMIDQPVDDEDADDTTDDAEDEGETEEADEEDETKLTKDNLTLERLFPEDSYWGTSARGMAFSGDGRFGAYLYRPNIERRHGNDIYLFDTETQTTRRITNVTVMSPFQESTRKVREDRIEKAKKTDTKDENKEDADEDVDAVDDPVSGKWEGTLTSEDDNSEIPPGGVSVTLELELDEDGKTVTGFAKAMLIIAHITSGNYDEDPGSLQCDLEANIGQDGETIGISIDGIIVDDSLSGTITVDVADEVYQFVADRIEKTDESDDEDSSSNWLTDLVNKVHGDNNSDSDDENNNNDEDGNDDSEEDEIDLGLVVSEKDADDKKAPRYSGISRLMWSPDTHEMIFHSQGDLYRFDIDADTITRLTSTRESERDVQYLPDGSGYTFMRGDALLRVTFGSHLIEQIDPKLPGGESMISYRLSPDGNRLVILTGKGESYWNRGRQVNIVNYRGRFAGIRTVTRHMSDDPMTDYNWSVHLYELGDRFTDRDQIGKVYTHKQSGPRDIMRVPEWAPDSSRVAFAVFEQTSGHVEILEAIFPTLDDVEEEDDADDDETDNGSDEDADDSDDEDEDTDDSDNDLLAVTEDIEFGEARAVYRFLHNGGPNTPEMIHPQYLADSRKMVFVTEQSGFRHLHILDPLYESLEQITHGKYEVYPIEITQDHKTVFFESTKDDPTQQQIYAIDLESREMTQLSSREGVYRRTGVSPDGQYLLATFYTFGKPMELVLDGPGVDESRELTDSHQEEAHILTSPVPEYFTYKNRHGHEIYGHMFKPDDWTPDDKRPLLIYVYGGPLGTDKMLSRGSYYGSAYFFAYYMAKVHGYITCTIDPRGASGYGGLFEKANYEQVGIPQTEDLVDGAKWLIDNHGADPDRIGLHGWSFGGFQTQMCLYTEPDFFACGIAGAGPTEWENYNSWYSTGTIGESRKGKTDLAKFSLLPLTKNLKARLLLIHGMEDANVLYQDTVRVYRELLKNDKETLVDLFLDPTGGHGMGGDVKRLGQFRKYEDFLLKTIGEGEPFDNDDDAEDTASDDNTEDDEVESEE